MGLYLHQYGTWEEHEGKACKNTYLGLLPGKYVFGPCFNASLQYDTHPEMQVPSGMSALPVNKGNCFLKLNIMRIDSVIWREPGKG